MPLKVMAWVSGRLGSLKMYDTRALAVDSRASTENGYAIRSKTQGEPIRYTMTSTIPTFQIDLPAFLVISAFADSQITQAS